MSAATPIAAPDRDALLAAYGLPDRETHRVRMNFVASLDGGGLYVAHGGHLAACHRQPGGWDPCP